MVKNKDANGIKKIKKKRQLIFHSLHDDESHSSLIGSSSGLVLMLNSNDGSDFS